MSAAFVAAYPGSCQDPECGTGLIRAGEIVHYVDEHAIAHVRCPAEPPPAAVCPSCHLALPATGVCEECA